MRRFPSTLSSPLSLTHDARADGTAKYSNSHRTVIAGPRLSVVSVHLLVSSASIAAQIAGALETRPRGLLPLRSSAAPGSSASENCLR